jgi:heterogeneous nuclear ribonucleoprotein U-like protein 1
MKQHPEKRYTLLSTDNILEQMKVAGLTRQRNYSERWEQLMPEASSVLNKLISIAASRKRNFLWDQVACT